MYNGKQMALNAPGNMSDKDAERIMNSINKVIIE